MAPIIKKQKLSTPQPHVEDPTDSPSGSDSENSESVEGESESGEEGEDADFPNEYALHQRTRIELSPSPEPAPSTTTALPSRINLPSRIPPSKPKPSSPKPTTHSTPQQQQPPPAVTPDEKKTFSSIGVSNALIAAMGTMSIRRPTSIQEGCIPAILAGRDCIGLAQTGSGKTLAFALPILQRISQDPYGIWAIVLTPTRELAFQIAEQFHILGVPLHIKTSVVVGGMDVIAQAQELVNRPHIVVATPGRLVDLLKSSGGEWGLDKVQTLVLDEADRMLTPTFAADLAYLFSRLPEERQTCLFTATESDAIRSLEAREPKKGKEKIFVHKVASDTTTVSTLKQHYLFIPSHIREPYLYHLLLNPPSSIHHLIRPNPNVNPEPTPSSSSSDNKRKRQRGSSKPSVSETEGSEDAPPWPPSTIIFTSRCQTAAHLQALLSELLIPSVALHSYLSQAERLQSLSTFRAGRAPVLIATDVGSRGLDIPEVAMVINWDCPRVGEDYVHRVGRTARAGRGGVAITMITERDTELVEVIEKKINATLTEFTLPEDKVLESLNKVSTAKRVAAMALHDSGFGEKQKNRAALEKKRQKRDAAKKAIGA